MAYYASDLNEPLLTNWQSKLTWTISASFLNETPLQGFEPLIAITNGDLSGWNRIIANTTRAMLPLSGGAGVLANAIDSAQKDLNGEIGEYIKNRLPFFKNSLANQIDIWTGQPLNDVDHPFLKMFHALSPIKVSGTAEPWRQWLQEIEYDGLSRLRKDSSGSYEYTTKEREYIYKKIGEMQLYKKVQALMKSERYRDEIKALRLHRSTNADLLNKRLVLKKKLLPVYKELDRELRRAQKLAEQMLLTERPDIAEVINKQQYIDRELKQGNVEGAAGIQQRDLETQQLLNMSK